MYFHPQKCTIRAQVHNLLPQNDRPGRRYQYFEQADHWLSKAREGIHDTRTDGWAGRKRRVLDRLRDIEELLRPHLTDQDKARIWQWLGASEAETHKEEHSDLPVLAQWGLAEILDRLHEVSDWLVTKTRYSEALNLLVSA